VPKRRVAILHQGCIPTYRRRFYELLAESKDCEYVVFHGEPEPGTGLTAAKPPFSFPNRWVKNRFSRVLGRSIVYQPVVLRILFGKFDALVLGHEMKFVANILLLLLFRMLGKPVVFWGFGHTIDPFIGERGVLGRWVGGLVDRIKSGLIRMATGYMAYTEIGAEYVRKVGMPRDRVSVLWNTIDVSDEIAAHAELQAVNRDALRRELGVDPGAVVLTFVGRLFTPKRPAVLPDLVEAIRAEHHLPVEVLVVGDGPERAQLNARFAGKDWCHLLGPVYDRMAIARIFRISDALVIPGLVGLAVNHAFAHGVPVITCTSEIHSPEFDYIVDGENGLVLVGDAGLSDGLRRFAQAPELRAHLVAGALATREKLGMERMTEGFQAAVLTALSGR
jgi:glycosyltransferase involved in cell wall biosynthesis